MNARWMIAICLIAAPPAVIFAAVMNSRQQPARPPNIVFILADDLGINDLRCYGRREHSTPNLDRLAREGMRFTSAYCAQPICSPSRAALLTGKTPARLHLTTYLPGRPDCPSQKLLHPTMRQALPLEEVTIAEELKAAGYATACLGKWHLGGAAFGPEKQGFDVVFDPPANTAPSQTEGGKGEFALASAAERFLEENRSRPFFLYLPHNNPHIPLAAQPERIARFRSAYNPLYAAMVETLDDSVGRVLRKLNDLGLAKDTMVVFTSDNGGLHVPEGRDTPATHNSPFRAGKGYLYEGGLRIPLIVRWPGRIKPNAVQSTPVINTDWPATFRELAGIADAPNISDGISLTPLLAGRVSMPERSFYWHFPHYTNQGGRPGGAVRERRWKLIEHYEDGSVELYDLSRDRREARDLAALEPSRAAELKSKLAAWRKSVDAQANRPNPELDARLWKQLYQDVDTSRIAPTRTAAKTAARFQDWRRQMNEAIR